jgi:hypothetical protein
MDRWLGHRPLRLIREFSRPLTDPKWRTKRGFKNIMFEHRLLVYALSLRTKEYTADWVPHTYLPGESIMHGNMEYEVVERWRTYIKLKDKHGYVQFYPLHHNYLLHAGKLCTKDMIMFDWRTHAGPLPFSKKIEF